MKLQLLDIDRFIERKNIQPVTTSAYYEGSGRSTFHSSGLFSEEVFGRVGSRDRKKHYGYINLKLPFIHPESYKILTKINPDLTKFILNKETYNIENGKLIKDENGISGAFHFIQNFDKIDFDNIKTEKPKHVDYLKRNVDKIFITKFLVLPAGFRDIQMTGGKKLIQHSEINELYVKLINQANMLTPDLESFDPELMGSLFNNTQRTLISINSWLKERLKGKQGLVRGMLKKVTDFSARLVITPSNKLDMGYIGLPVQVILKLYEPFFIHHVLRKDRDNLIKNIIQKYLDVEEVDTNTIKRFVNKINETPMDVDSITENILVEIAEKITENKVVAYKRDPTESRDSWISCYIQVNKIGFTAQLNSLDLEKNGKNITAASRSNPSRKLGEFRKSLSSNMVILSQALAS